jgi:hypothetical protein
MSYYMSDFDRNPPASYPPSGSARTTVPGWGVLPVAAGPARIAVGAAAGLQPRMYARGVTAEEVRAAQEAREGRIPWWLWVALPGVAIGGLALAANRGWIG